MSKGLKSEGLREGAVSAAMYVLEGLCYPSNELGNHETVTSVSHVLNSDLAGNSRLKVFLPNEQ